MLIEHIERQGPHRSTYLREGEGFGSWQEQLEQKLSRKRLASRLRDVFCIIFRSEGCDEHTTLSSSSWEEGVAKDKKKGSSKAKGYDEHTTLSASSWEKVVAKDKKKGSSKGKQNKVLAG